jgi:nucleoside-diphosphate-sugar epimerase
MRILVTGGGGYLGSTLVPRLLDSGHAVRVLDRFVHDGRHIVHLAPHPLLEIMPGDVRDPWTARSALRKQDAVIHLAALVGYPACVADPEEAKSTNVAGTRAIAKLVSGRPLVLASTCSVYGRADGLCDEATPTAPLTLYGTTKLEAEAITLDAGGTVLRFATLFGAAPKLRLDLLVNDFVKQAVYQRYLSVYQAEFRRSFLHVRDAARSCAMVLEQIDRTRETVYNVADERTGMTKQDLAERIRKHVPFDLDLNGDGLDSDQRDYEVASGRIRSLGFTPRYTLDDGIEELVRVISAMKAEEETCQASKY